MLSSSLTSRCSAKPPAGGISEKIRVGVNGAQQGMFIKGKDLRQSPAALSAWRHARLLPYTALPPRSRPVFHRGLVGAARFRTLIQRRPPAGDREPGATGVRHCGVDQLPAQTFRPREDLPHGAFRGHLHRHTSGCAGPRPVPRLHRRSADVESAGVRETGIRLHAPEVQGTRGT